VDNENPVNERVGVPEEVITLVVAEGKPEKEYKAEPVETAATPVPAVAPQVTPNAGKLNPEVVLLVLVEVTAVAPLAGEEACVIVSVENNGVTVAENNVSRLSINRHVLAPKINRSEEEEEEGWFLLPLAKICYKPI
jgi:hypothetical protein